MAQEMNMPFILKNKTLLNRFALAPLTNCQSQADGTLGQDEYEWLLRSALSGFSVITTCATYIMPSAKAWQGQLGIDNPVQVAVLKRLTSEIKKHYSFSIMQLFHGGVRCPSALTGLQPVSASEYELPFPNFEKPRALLGNEIQEIVEAFSEAAVRAYQAGFDGIELHGANGYLITQFLSTQTNLRVDEYGGSLLNRAKFARDIVRACQQKLPADFIIGMRLSPEGFGLDVDEILQVATWLKADGLDYISLSLGNFAAPPQKYTQLSDKPLMTYFREKLGKAFPLFVGGGIQSHEDAALALAYGADMLTLGRMAIGNPRSVTEIQQKDSVHLHKPPYTLDYLRQTGLSEPFIRYIESLPKGFILL